MWELASQPISSFLLNYLAPDQTMDYVSHTSQNIIHYHYFPPTKQAGSFGVELELLLGAGVSFEKWHVPLLWWAV